MPHEKVLLYIGCLPASLIPDCLNPAGKHSSRSYYGKLLKAHIDFLWPTFPLCQIFEVLIACLFSQYFFNKSTSICNCQTFLKSSVISFSSSFLTTPFSIKLGAIFKNLLFRIEICAGCKSYFFANSLIVSRSCKA